MAGNYGLDELFRDLTGIGAPTPTPAPRPAPAPRRQTPTPAPAPAARSQGQTPAPRPSNPSTRSGARGDKNNNPGNLEDGRFARSQPGYMGSDGRFARFQTAAQGEAAQVNLLRRNYRGLTPAQIIQKYAPLGDNSEASVRNYIGYIAARSGIDPDAPVPDNQLARFAGAMREFENGRTLSSVRFNPYGGQLQGGNRQMAGGQGGRGVTPRGNVDRWLESALPPEVAASQGVRLPEGAAETLAQAPGQIQERQAGVERNLDEMGNRLDVLQAASEAAQVQQVASRTQQVEDSRRINEEIVAGTEQLTRQVKPVMEARTRIADQMDKLATMNPLERSLRGIFDLNYDEGYLSRQLDRFDRTLAARLYDYQYLDTLQNVALREIDRRYGIDTALSDLEVQQGTEDLALVNQRLGLASQMLSSTRESLATQSQLIVAQTQMRENVLSRIDTPTVMQLMTQAQANGGIVTHDGIEFSYKELRDRAELAEQQQRAIRSNQIALAQGEMNLAEGLATDLARSLTRQQLEGVAQNGGVYVGPNGEEVVIPQDTITQLLENHRVRDERKAQDILTRMPGHIAEQSGIAAVNSISSLFSRTARMMSPQDRRQAGTQVSAAADLLRQLGAAIGPDGNPTEPPEVIQALLAKIGEAQTNFQKSIGQTVLRSVGGDKQAAGYVESFVHGTPLNPGTAAEALTYFALKGGLPDGLAVSPEARQVFVRAQQIANQNRIQDGKAVSFERLTSIVQSELGEYAAQIIGTPRLNDVLRSLPAHAKQVGHPFGRLRPDWWRETYTDAQSYATQELANTLKTTPRNVQVMMERMAPVDSTPAMDKLFKDFLQQAGQYNAIEQRFILERLDNSNPLVPGRSNVELFEELLYSPELHQQVNRTTDTIEGNSFGDFLVGPMSQGAGQQALIDYARDVGNSASAGRISAQTAAREKNQVWGSNGAVRVMSVLRSIPQIKDTGAERLRPFVQQVIQNRPRVNPTFAPMPVVAQASQQGQGMGDEAAVLEALRSTKFDDPSMEAYRRAAIQHWTEYSSLGDTFMQNFQHESRR